jgi:hypothetical protein
MKVLLTGTFFYLFEAAKLHQSGMTGVTQNGN